jgi:3-isopropylmalate/(R)-2-methylmalate dehydratase small subunit
MNFVNFSATAVPLKKANIDTDQILPKQFLSGISREGFGQHLFHNWRYLDPQGKIKNPEFVLNQTAYKGAKILISGANFGCGSSREHAPWALAGFGFEVIIASSFADIFYANCINNQILPITLKENVIEKLVEQVTTDPTCIISIDLQAKWLKQNEHLYPFEIIAEYQLSLLNGLDVIEQSLSEKDAIATYEKQRPSWSNISLV